jgi:hypothetical protein
MTSLSWIAWVPLSAPAFITGRYAERVFDHETRTFDPQAVEAACGKCKAILRHSCESGRPREWIARFVTVHRHENGR